jgi:hypothetical protein
MDEWLPATFTLHLRCPWHWHWLLIPLLLLLFVMRLSIHHCLKNFL